jgi:hypothetical protein
MKMLYFSLLIQNEVAQKKKYLKKMAKKNKNDEMNTISCNLLSSFLLQNVRKVNDKNKQMS